MSQYVLKPRKGLNFILLAGLDKRKEDASCFSAEVIAMKEPVFTSNDEGFNGALTKVIIKI